MAKFKNKKNEFKPRRKKKYIKNIIITILILLVVIVGKLFIDAINWKKLSTEMVNNGFSIILDSNQNCIAKFGAEKNRENVKIDQIPENLKNAYVSIEDERYFEHFGIDIKRTAGAIAYYILHLGKVSFGASTITQQLVKNLTGDDEATVLRKVREWIRATELELWLDKNQILEAYLNIIYVGPNIYGVKNGGKYYFSKDIQDLSLAECAFLAGINNAPIAYNPFSDTNDNTEKIKKRTKTVLKKMFELNYIDENSYNTATSEVENGLKFSKTEFYPESNGVYSYHTDALLTELISQIANSKNITTKFATNYLQMAGLTIYGTQNTEIQNEMEIEFEKSFYRIPSLKDNSATAQAAMIIINHKNGEIVGCVGGLGNKTESRGFNRATQAIRQTGSSSKPIAIIAPALAEYIITPVTTYVDEPSKFIDSDGEEYSPINYNKYIGQITVRRAIESSQNIPFVKMIEQLTPQKSVEYLRKMGITTLSAKDANLALALGGEDNGISVLEMAGAYSTIANDGTYIEPTFYTKVVDKNSKIVVKSNQKSRYVFSKAVCFITKQLLTQPVLGQNGTAGYCKMEGIDVAAKTGTTNENFDRWLCGFTNYYTAVTWYGYDLSERINFHGNNPAGVIWTNVMKKIHTGLENSKFDMPEGVSEKTICKKSGQVANNSCTETYTEYFLPGTEPQNCSIHK